MARDEQRLIPIVKCADIPRKYRGTSVGRLLEYQNLERPFQKYDKAQLLVGMCMDSRKHLRIPENFAFILRTGGANLRYSEFKVSYAIAVGGVRCVVLLGHDQCGMVNLMSRKEQFISGLVTGAGWTRERAEEHFMNLAPMHEIDNEIEFTLSETQRLKRKYPKIMVAPLFYKLREDRLYCIG
jgi:carbonic anhydrase